MSENKELEWQTRKNRVNKKLRALNWTIVKYNNDLKRNELTNHAIEEYPIGNERADYALFVNNKLLGIIEAKKLNIGPQNVLEQAKRYSKGAFKGVGNWHGCYRVPFLYSTNGEKIYFIDIREEKPKSREIYNFHTPKALEELFYNEKSQYSDWFSNNSVNVLDLRYYQKEAIQEIEKSILQGDRAMLLAMATGTGKTRTIVAQVYRLLKSKIAKRVLFLVDRKSLAAQAVQAFSAFNTPGGLKFNQEYEVFSQKIKREDFGERETFNPNILPLSYLTSPESHTFVYVSTIQRMAINLKGKEAVSENSEGDYNDESDAEKLDIPINAFDIIIADECHRGYTSKETSIWREIINYFDAVKIGLTATPAPHSLSLFNNVIYKYTVEKAIEDGFLVDYEAVKIHSNVRMNGAFLKEGELVGIINPETGEEIHYYLEDEREFASGDIERKITSYDCNKKIIEEIARYAFKHEEEKVYFPKILIFAVNDLQHISHSEQIVKICREVFNRGDDFVHKITGNPNVDRPLEKIRKFRNQEEPKIVVTVDMLSTGVDIPCIEFIVFLRPVKSRILWVQMLGRGTRLCKDINKTHFTIFDCFDGTLIEYFRNTNDFNIEPPAKETIPVKTIIENIYKNIDKPYNVKVLVKRLHRIGRDMSGEAMEKFSSFIQDGDLTRFASELQEKIKNDYQDTIKILRNNDFQDLLINYPKPEKTFMIGYEVIDKVSSEILIRYHNKDMKPQDYLEAFSKFIKENKDQIEAIKILLNRPEDWKTNILNDLRKKLSLHSFQEEKLKEAHKVVYNKALADIISMIRHAADEKNPILTAEERIERVMNKIKEDKTFTEEQLIWLGFIHDHLILNLTIDLDALKKFPIFELEGGLGKAKRVFGDKLEYIITEINSLVLIAA